MSIKIIADLGMKHSLTNKNRKFRFYLIECECGKRYQIRQPKRIQRCTTCHNKIVAETINLKHGDSRRNSKNIGNNLITRYESIKSRCYNKNHQSYAIYGGAGVTMCDEWKNNYQAFKDWSLSNGYQKDLVLDKDYLCKKLNISPKIYSPETCQWIDRSENSKSNQKFTIQEENEIVQMYLEGFIVANIAKKFNKPWNTIKAVLVRKQVYKKNIN